MLSKYGFFLGGLDFGAKGAFGAGGLDGFSSFFDNGFIQHTLHTCKATKCFP